MENHNSLEIYISLYRRLIQDIADCYADSDHWRDWHKLQSRIESEGFSFLTKNLPKLGKAFDKALQGECPFLAVGFQKLNGTQLPKLFGWLFKRVFSDDGHIRSDADVKAIKHIRQLLYFLYKLELPYAEKTSKKVLNAFVSVEQELKQLSVPEDAVVARASRIIARVLSRSNPRDIVPRNGPGSVSTGELGGEKSHFSRLYDSLERFYPHCEYFRLAGQLVDSLDAIQALEVLSTGTAKVVLVPKDSRGPRLISCEPLELQWIQQGQQKLLYSELENHWMTAGRVNFTDQSINRSLALASSLSREFVTLDMKDASDRVSCKLVRALFSGSAWLEALMASRSAATRMPDGVVVELEKFAPMGSAVCFPVEALVFFALAIGVLVVYRNYRWQDAIQRVYVYGDDLIVRSEDYAAILEHFPKYGLVFNETKCCVSGFFRESCGCDAYKGVDVTPLRLRKRWGRSHDRTPEALVSYVELHNSLGMRGYRRTCTYIRKMVEDRYGILPWLEYMDKHNLNDSQSFKIRPGQVIGWYLPDVNPAPINKMRGIQSRFQMTSDNPHKPVYQVHEVYGYSVKPVHKDYDETGWEACFRRLCEGSTGLPAGVYAVARRSRLKRTWGSMGVYSYKH